MNHSQKGIVQIVAGIKASKGAVGIETFQGRLRLRLPRSLYEGKQKYITLGLSDTEENRAIAEPYRAQCELDIKINQFDWTHRKYKPGSHLTVIEEMNYPAASSGVSKVKRGLIVHLDAVADTHFPEP